MSDHGPFESEDDARMTPAVRAVWETVRASDRRGVMDELNLAMLDGACAAAGIESGAYGRRILAWLANMEPQTCEVFADLIIRAHEAGMAAATAGGETQWGLRLTHEPGDEPIFDPYRDEETARSMVATFQGVFDTVVVRRQLGPWEEAPDA